VRVAHSVCGKLVKVMLNVLHYEISATRRSSASRVQSAINSQCKLLSARRCLEWAASMEKEAAEASSSSPNYYKHVRARTDFFEMYGN
jgi:hypothetical protein